MALWKLTSKHFLVALLDWHLKITIFLFKLIQFALVKVLFAFVKVGKGVVHRRTIVCISISYPKTRLNHVF